MPGDNPEPPPPDAFPTTEATDEEIAFRSDQLRRAAERPTGHGDIESPGFDPDVYRAERIAGVRPPSPWPRHRGTPGPRPPGDPPGEIPPAPARPRAEGIPLNGNSRTRLVAFLYVLARDDLSTGRIEQLLRDHVEPTSRITTFSSPQLAALAEEWAKTIIDGVPKQNRPRLDPPVRRCDFCSLPYDEVGGGQREDGTRFIAWEHPEPLCSAWIRRAEIEARREEKTR